MVDEQRYAFWRRALAGDFAGWDSEDAPFPGFYRARWSPHQPWLPAAIWDAAGRPAALLDGSIVRPLMLWSALRCWQYPVSEAAYRHARATGEWADTLHASEVEDNAGKPVVDVGRAEPIGPRRRT